MKDFFFWSDTTGTCMGWSPVQILWIDYIYRFQKTVQQVFRAIEEWSVLTNIQFIYISGSYNKIMEPHRKWMLSIA